MKQKQHLIKVIEQQCVEVLSFNLYFTVSVCVEGCEGCEDNGGVGVCVLGYAAGGEGVCVVRGSVVLGGAAAAPRGCM